MPRLAIRSARPTFLVEGQEHTALSEGLLEMSLVENTLGLHRCEAVFGNWGTIGGQLGYLYFDRALLEFGRHLVIQFDDRASFDGRIVGLEARYPQGRAPEIGVLAEDRLQDLRMTRRTRQFDDASDADVVNRIAGEHGLQADVQLDGPTHRVIAQVNQSDLAFLRERVRALGGELWVEERKLVVRTRQRRNGETLDLTLGHGLHEFTALADLAHQRTRVTVGGWDVAAKQGLSVQAGDSAIQPELNGDLGGASILQSALGERRETLAHAVPWTQREAQVLAETHFRNAARRFVLARGVADGDARLRVGARPVLHGLGPMFDGSYYLTEVTHRFDGARGLRTEFIAERPGIGRP
jgi:phage protein D